ncbi:response regulator transcription factor [Caldimonas brevitalea]|uniref:response regulator n=1 Tax=Caldimonas brevitalea TaxID=413882 RepID=UPI00063FD980|nr:response regulator transcription factor [Caldimonas brevitalea]
MTIRVLIADDHPLVADALSTGVREHNIEVVGRTTQPAEVLEMYERLSPDVLVLDVRFGRGAASTGLDVARQLLGIHEQARVVFYTQFDSDPILRESYLVGASAFLPKSSPLTDVAEAIAKVHAEGTYFLPDVARRMALLSLRRDTSPQSLLEPRELEVFRYMALGMETTDIAERMRLSPKTISNVRQVVKQKLKEEHPARLALLAVQAGVIDTEQLSRMSS